MSRASGLHGLVAGRVQGVGFRAFLAGHARALALRGWVRNTVDGRVEFMICGHDAAMAVFERECRAGPRWSRVDEVVITDAVLDKAPLGFEILRD